jgi:branched-chain amino acid aminotransferase
VRRARARTPAPAHARADLDVITPELDGTILPGLTRASVLALARAHPARAVLPGLARSTRLHPREARVTLADVAGWARAGRLREAFSAGTAVVIAPIGRIGFAGAPDLVLPVCDGKGGLGPVGSAIRERIVDVQEGREEWDGWSVACE